MYMFYERWEHLKYWGPTFWRLGTYEVGIRSSVSGDSSVQPFGKLETSPTVSVSGVESRAPLKLYQRWSAAVLVTHYRVAIRAYRTYKGATLELLFAPQHRMHV